MKNRETQPNLEYDEQDEAFNNSLHMTEQGNELSELIDNPIEPTAEIRKSKRTAGKSDEWMDAEAFEEFKTLWKSGMDINEARRQVLAKRKNKPN